MEHEVVVPLPATVVQQALQDPELLVRCVPGLSTDAEEDAETGAATSTAEKPGKGGGKAGGKNAGGKNGAKSSGKAAGKYAFGDEIGGRLRLRIGGSTITYRGVISLIEGREGVLTAFAEGQESRGSGEASATVRIAAMPTVSATEGGDETESTTIRFTGDLSASGRLTELDSTTLTTAGRRLLDRFAAALAAEAGGEEPPGATVVYLEAHAPGFGSDLDEDLSDLIAFSDEDVFAAPKAASSETPAAETDRADGTAETEEAEDEEADDVVAAESAQPESAQPESAQSEGSESAEEREREAEAAAAAAAAAAEIPDSPADLGYEFEQEYEQGFGYDQDRPAEEQLSGPVRRSIVGRSAEEVDHAPPRGRYAPAPPARSARARAATRWAGADAAPVGVGPAGDRSAMPWVIGGGVALLGGAVVLVRALRRR